MLPLFLYGTLRPGSWNHERWLAPFLAHPCRPAALPGYVLHEAGGLPYLVADGGGRVVGDLAELVPGRYEEAIGLLDELEGVADGHYRREAATTEAGEVTWVWLAGAERAATLGESTVVPGGDWLRCR